MKRLEGIFSNGGGPTVLDNFVGQEKAQACLVRIQ